MRYDDWDVLIFPSGITPKVPLKEFKVACNLVPDHEFSHGHSSAGMPIMTCFVPSLQPTLPFHISIHSWTTPEPSQLVQSLYSQHIDLMKFEARLFIDGHLVAYKMFGLDCAWPIQIDTGFGTGSSAQPDRLQFPSFRDEVLYQHQWHPGDDIGRIKLTLTEGFSRSSQSMPLERVNNLVTFSFLYAPLNVLERTGIAWPNPSMWLRGRAVPAATYFKQNPDADVEAVDYVSQNQSGPIREAYTHMVPRISNPHQDSGISMFCPAGQDLSTSACSFTNYGGELPAPATSLGGFDGGSHWADAQPLGFSDAQSQYGPSWIDPSMPGCTMPFGTEGMFSSAGSADDESFGLRAPTNTPTAGQLDPRSMAPLAMPYPSLPPDLAVSLTHALLNQPVPLPTFASNNIDPAPEAVSREENRRMEQASSGSSSAYSPPNVTQGEIRKVSAPMSTLGHFLQRSFSMGRRSSRSATPGSNSQGVFSASSSRTVSAGEFGGVAPLAGVINTAASLSTMSSQKRGRAVSSSLDQGEEDEPHRVSPSQRQAISNIRHKGKNKE